MGKEEIKAVSEILSNTTKFRRSLFIILFVIGIICLTIIIIAGIAFYTGAVTYHGK
jgi:hypothetical protein